MRCGERKGVFDPFGALGYAWIGRITKHQQWQLNSTRAEPPDEFFNQSETAFE